MRIDYNTYALPSVHHFNSSVNRRAPDMAVQHRLGILSQRRFGFNFVNRVACCFAAIASAKPSQHAIACTRLVHWRCPQHVGETAAALQPDISAFGDLFPSSSEKPIHLLNDLHQTFWRSGLRAWVSFCNPSSNRVFTVPSGARVAMAISLWLSPLKKASSRASR